MRSLKRPLHPQLTWTPDDLGIFVEQVHDDRFFALWMLIVTTGVPMGALAALERDGVDAEKRRIDPSPRAAPGCDGRSQPVRRSFALDPDAYDALREHVVAWEKERRVLRQETQKLFVWSNGEQVDTGAIRTMFRQHCSIAGLPVVPLDAVRQAYVVAAIDSGIPVKVIGERLGDNVQAHSLRHVAPAIGSAPAPGQVAEETRDGNGSWC